MIGKVNSFKELTPLIFPYMKRGVVTNNFTSPEVYRAEIQENRLFYHKTDCFLALLFQRQDFCAMTFYYNGGEVLLPEGLPLICEAAELSVPFLLEAKGFIPFYRRVHMTRENGAVEGCVPPAVSLLSPEQAEEGYRLLTSCFDSCRGALPTFTEFSRDCASEGVLVLREEGQAVGLLRERLSGKKAEIRHLCVHPSFRGKGVGGRLCRAFLHRRGGNVCSVWTGEENLAAQALYRRYGFLCDSKTSVVYKKGF